MKLPKKVWIAGALFLLLLIIAVSLLTRSQSRTAQEEAARDAATAEESASEIKGDKKPTGTNLFSQIKNKIVGEQDGQAVPTGTNAEMLAQKGALQFKGTDITYGNGFKGYYSSPVKAATYPGVVMIHEWWGLNDHIKEMADILASNGYNVVAVDLYDGNVAKSPEDARSYVTSLDKEKTIANMKAAKAYLKEKGSPKIGSLGWCFGGGQSLQLSINEPLDATVIYYGTPVTDTAQLSKIKSPVLGIFGDKDASIPVDTVNSFRSALLSAGVQNNIELYPGVGHAFANPSGDNYAPEETKSAWKKTLTFLTTHLH